MSRTILKYTLLCILIFVGTKLFAQQDPMFTQYLNNPGIINPAYAGSKGVMNVNGTFRKQWLGMDWSPTTSTITYSSPFFKYDVGVGVTLINDNIGPINQTGLYVDYSKFFILEKDKVLSLGLKTGLNYFDIDLLSLIMTEQDPYLIANDNDGKFLPNFGIGAYYFTTKYYLGFSIPKIIRNSYKAHDNTLEALGREERHYFLTAGYVFSINDPVWKIKASTMARVVNGAPVSLDVSATLIVLERVWFGLSYRFGDAIAAHVRLEIDERFQLGYSYDMNNSRLKKYNSGSHEIFLSYNFSFMNDRVMSPRYF